MRYTELGSRPHRPLEDGTLHALDDLISRSLVRHLGWADIPGWYTARSEASRPVDPRSGLARTERRIAAHQRKE